MTGRTARPSFAHGAAFRDQCGGQVGMRGVVTFFFCLTQKPTTKQNIYNLSKKLTEWVERYKQ